MGGRAAELLVYGDLSTGASNDLVGNTELARKMVREWGMSDKIGPMAWGSQGQVFLGEDLMHTRDYSEHTSQIIDDEVEIILRAQEERALEVLARHRGGLDAVARALLDEETIDGETVGRLVDTAYGRPVHEHGVKMVPPIFVASQHGPTGSDDVDGPPGGANGAASPGVAEPAPGTVGASAPAPSDLDGVPAEDGVPNASRAVDQPPAGQPSVETPSGDASQGAQTAPPAPQAGHWPQAPSGLPVQPAPGHWPKQAPWPPPPPPPTSR
jgi:hypothetical protein